MDIGGRIDAEQACDGGQEIHHAGRFVFDVAGPDRARPMEDPRNPVPALEVRAFLAAQIADPVLAIAAVVRGVDDQGVVELADLLESRDQAGNGAVGVVDGSGVDRGGIVELAVLRDDFGRGGDRRMGFVEPDVEEERPPGRPPGVEPRDRVVDNDLGGIAFGLADSRAISNEVDRVPVARPGVVVGGEVVVETVLVWRRLVATVKRRAEVPLADVGGGVAVRFEQLGQRDFALEQVHVVGAVVDHVVDAGPDVMPTGHENRAGRRTDTAAGMEIREPHTVGS